MLANLPMACRDDKNKCEDSDREKKEDNIMKREKERGRE